MAKRPAFPLRAPRGPRNADTGAPRWRVSRETTLSHEHHKSLLDSLMQLIAPAVHVRNQMIPRYDRVTRDMSAYLQLKGESQELAKRTADSESASIPDQRFPLAEGHIQNVSSEVMNILFPARNMYGSTALEVGKENVARSFLAVMNLHSQQFAHYPQYDLMVTDALTYNLGVIEVNWRIDSGFVAKAEGGTTQPVRQGCEILRLDPYNTLLDYSVPFDKYSTDAEFYGKVERVSEFYVRKQLLEGQWFGPAGVEKALQVTKYADGKVVNKTTHSPAAPFYGQYTNFFGSDSTSYGLYKERPATRPPEYYASQDCGPGRGRADGAFDSDTYFNGAKREVSAASVHKNELLTITAKLVPQDYGLSNETERQLQVWQFKVLNGHWIVSATPLMSVHGMLPVGVTAPAAENGAMNSRSLAEKLVPYQDWISNIYNLYVKEMRKRVNNGMVFYDPKRVKLNEMRDPTSGFIPVSVPEDTDTATDRTVGSAVFRMSEQAPLNTTINDIAQVVEMMQATLPTDQLGSMSGLNRAVDHQSKVVASAAARRTFRIARVISDQAIAPAMFIVTMQIVMLQPSITLIDETGQPLELNPEIFRDSDLKISVSDGLRGIDNVAIANRVSEMVRYALQSRRTQEEIDVLSLMGYLLHLEGANFDMNQFRYKNPMDSLDQNSKNIAFQLFQQYVAAQEGGNTEEQQAPA